MLPTGGFRQQVRRNPTKRPAQGRPFQGCRACWLRRSVPCDDRTAPAVVHPYRSHVHALTDIVASRDRNGRRRERNVGTAHEQVVVFNGNGPAWRKADFNSCSHSTTPTGIACQIERDTGCGENIGYGEEAAVFIVGDG